jgi:triosephosphate isomerase
MTAGPGKPFVAGNWKMNLTVGQARALASAVAAGGSEFGPAEVVLIPPFTLLCEVRAVTGTGPVSLGAQDCHWEEKGAFTGEVSAPMLVEAGCRYVVVGHSERRQLFGETDLSVNRKLKSALKHGLTPIFCLGETLEERREGRMEERILSQLAGGLDGLDEAALARIVTAYEPIWAIGTGQTATPNQAEAVQALIRDWFLKKLAKRATGAIILYGGSVKPDNAFSLYGEKNIDGFLVGGASLEAGSFLGIIKEAVKADRIKK